MNMRCFYFLPNVAMNFLIQYISMAAHVHVFVLGMYLGIEVLSHWFCIFLTLVDDGIVFQRDCTSSHCHLQCMSLPIVPCPCEYLELPIILILSLWWGCSGPTCDPNAFFWWLMRLSCVSGSFGYLICESLFKSLAHFSIVLPFLFLIDL